MKTLPDARTVSDIARNARSAGPGGNDARCATAFASLVKAHPARDAGTNAASAATTASPHANAAAAGERPAHETVSPRSKAHHADPMRKDAADARAKQRDAGSKDDETADRGSAVIALQAIATPIEHKPAGEGANPEPSPEAESAKTAAHAGAVRTAVPARSVQPDPTMPVEEDRSASTAGLKGADTSVENGDPWSGARKEPARGGPAAVLSPGAGVAEPRPVVETDRHAVVPSDPAVDRKTLAAKSADGIAVEVDVQTTALGAPADPIVVARPALVAPTAMVDVPTTQAARAMPATADITAATSPSAPLVAGAPSLAIEITIAAARYTLPTARADEAPQAASSAEISDAGTQPPDPHRDYGARLKSVATPGPAAVAPAGVAGRPGSKAAAGVEAETPSLLPSAIKTGNARDTGPRTAARIDAQATPLAAQAPPAVASGPQQIQSPASSVASAIVAEPTWRPSSVAIATQSSVDRVPGTPRTLSVQLNPGSLGVVVANLSMSGSTLKVHLAAESREAHDRLKAETHAIEKAMHSLGYEVSEITITQSAVATTPPARQEPGPQDGSPPGRNPQSNAENWTGGDRPARRNGDRNGHESPSLQGVHATRAADASGSGVYI